MGTRRIKAITYTILLFITIIVLPYYLGVFYKNNLCNIGFLDCNDAPAYGIGFVILLLLIMISALAFLVYRMFYQMTK